MLGRLKLGLKDHDTSLEDSVVEDDVHLACLTNVGIPTSSDTVTYDSIQRMLAVRLLDGCSVLYSRTLSRNPLAPSSVVDCAGLQLVYT